VNITSVHEHTPLPQASAYTAAKHALGGLTKSMAMELVKHNILVNAVAPGAIATPMNDMDDSEVKEGSMPEIPLAAGPHERDCQPGGVAVRQRRQLYDRAIVYR
jgi:NAD(P)-dependent dehydrogenase (short-subunit alcohol dehydrogenase family)